jgi:CysZ protein
VAAVHAPSILGSMIGALARAIAQLDDPRFRRVAWLTLGISIATSIVLLIACWAALLFTHKFELGWLEIVTDIAGGFASLLLAWVLFPVVVSVVVTLWFERAARAVEARYYPDLPPPRTLTLAEQLIPPLRLALFGIVLNLIALTVFWVIPVYVFVFYGLNGYLVGREYFELVALRRMSWREVRDLRRRHRMSVLIAGVAIAGMLSIPLVNWVTPVIAIAFMVHIFERLRRKAGA